MLKSKSLFGSFEDSGKAFSRCFYLLIHFTPTRRLMTSKWPKTQQQVGLLPCIEGSTGLDLRLILYMLSSM